MPPPSSLTNKIKVQLKLSISRLRMVQQKDTALAKQARREMAVLLDAGKIESAKIRVENIIRSDLHTELLEFIELYCELLLARIGLLEAGGKECDAGLEEAVQSIIHAAPKIEGVKELTSTRNLLAEKFGKEFTLGAMENADGKIPPRIMDRLRVEPPAPELVQAYLETIADVYNIDYPAGRKAREAALQAAQEEAAGGGGGDDDDDDNPSGGQKVPALEAPLTAEKLNKSTSTRDPGPRSPVTVMPPSPSTDNVRPKISLPGAPDLTPSKKMTDAARKKDSGGGPGGKIPDVDELARRFAELKK